MIEDYSNFSTSVNHHIEKWNMKSPVNCIILNAIAVYCVILLLSSVFFNSLLLWVFYRYKELRTSLNMLIIALTAYNLAASVIELPFVIISNFSCRWPFGRVGCHFSGVVMYIVGIIQIYLMAAISFERFFIIYKPMSIKSISTNVILVVIAVCTFMGVMWAMFPYLGWSYYSLEGALTSCSVEWFERSFNVISYNVTIFLVVYTIPLIVIFFANIKLVIIIRNLPNMTKDAQDEKAKKRLQMERNLTVIMIFLVVGFVISWTPYAMVSLYSSFIGDDLPPLAGTLPAMFAKSTLVWSAILYIFSNKQIRVKLTMGLFYEKKEQDEVSMSRDKTVIPITNYTA
ncbi:rod opsin [Brachionus plicatilis]|uniref:Rod opsin n=1 Tax=Brachionus plicatilis TaxID=10195 RepID=A0A3M7S4B8_BRAPC|nr:rod opsin [Brachionus plicatilis]